MSGGHMSTPFRTVLCSLDMVGKRLAASRERAGLTQKELADALGPRYDQAMVSRVESGHKGLRFDGVVKAARELQVSVDYLAGLTDTPQPATRLAGALAHWRARAAELEDYRALAPSPEDSKPRRDLFAGPGINPVPLLQNAGIAAGTGGDADHEHVLASSRK